MKQYLKYWCSPGYPKYPSIAPGYRGYPSNALPATSHGNSIEHHFISRGLHTFIPCHLEMALSGLNARNVLNDLKAVRLALPSIAKLRMETCKK